MRQKIKLKDAFRRYVFSEGTNKHSVPVQNAKEDWMRYPFIR